ncbi:DUF4347 domain-containing protein [Planctomycetes bacterium K23_9]|uniref:Inner spore coat protein H n=1 Tax=Stieleria marina TaxID=1930275 RepID=A0A517NP92_9BACT|nr:Inner spore coat protein H [Planctomycetes bacterium K23_9]
MLSSRRSGLKVAKSHEQSNRRRRDLRRRDLNWSLASLEQRIMLAADCGAVACEVASHSTGQQSATGQSVASQADATPQATTSASQVVFIDAAVDDIDHLVAGLNDGHELILLGADQSGLSQITDALSQRTNVSSVHIIAHGQSGQIQLGNGVVDQSVVQQHAGQIQSWSRALTSDADILIYGCETAADASGLGLIQQIAQLSGADVAASTDKTGAASDGADWDLERQVGSIEAGLAFDFATRNSYQSVMPITIRAAGQTGQEQMLLQIDGATVATFNNVGGDASNRNFQTFTYGVDGVSADDVRVLFTNDAYDPANGIDRNLIVDSINIDGVTFETEADNVFSSGVWVSDVGFVDGFQNSETLAGNGYFQYASGDTPPQEGAFAIINEIHYNPGPDGVVDGDAEFIELYNPGDQDFDLSGVSFTGFDLTFAEGTTLAAGQYAIVAPSISLAQSTWGVTPIAEFADGGISGGGETIQLIAADGVTVIDEVTYTDDAPWPGAPDGNGPSLELVNPSFDNNDSSSWRASNTDPTPAAQNSVFSDGVISDVTNITLTPGKPQPNQAFTISVTIPDASFATLTFKVMFGEDQTVQMTNSGGDVWQATVPGQEAGTLVRYRIDSDVATAPFEGDTINYLGVVVDDPDLANNSLPVFQWFVDPAQFDELMTDLFETNTKIPTVIAFGDQVIDNAEVRIRGSASRFFDKKGFKIELPKGYELDLGDNATQPVDEFGLVADFADWSVTSAQISWEIFNAETESQTSTFFTRVEQNGDFYGNYRFQELYDGTWRDANGFGDEGAEFYQAEDGAFQSNNGFDKKEPGDEDLTNINALREIVNSESSAEKTQWVYDNVDIPATINHMALGSLMRHYDQSAHNFYVGRDADTGRWSLVEWDLDLTWRDSYDFGGGLPLTTPEAIGNAFLDSVWEIPEIQDMYWQRLQTLVDTYLSTDYLINRRAELVAEIGETNSDLELEAWGRDNIFRSDYFVNDWQQNIDLRRSVFAEESRLPGNSVDAPSIVINELHYNPAGDDAEFLELYNASSQAVDLSGWSIDGVDLAIAPGTVILAGDFMVFTDNDAQFRAQTEGNIVVGRQYDGGLSGGGEAITLLDENANVIDQVSYDDSSPWPTEPDGDGFTLALRDPSLDNSDASNWAASQQLGGTPNASNGLTSETTQISIFATGTTASEIIELEIAGVVVATYDLGDNGTVIGDYAARNYIELVYQSEGAVAAADIRVNFVNDFFDSENGIDSNVRIDRIEIDGDDYQTEAPSVFSSGTWLSGVGITPGFRLSEILHANGYFQFDAIQPIG